MPNNVISYYSVTVYPKREPESIHRGSRVSQSFEASEPPYIDGHFLIIKNHYQLVMIHHTEIAEVKSYAVVKGADNA